MKRPMDERISILFVEDSETDAQLVLHHLESEGLRVECHRVESAEQMSGALQAQHWDIILCDYQLPDFEAPEALALLKASRLDVPLIVISGAVSEDVAVAVMKAGAQDYIPKNNLRRLVPAVEREYLEVRRRRERAEVEIRAGAIMDAAQDAIIMMDPAGLISFWNPAAEQILGYSAQEAIGRNLHSLLAPPRYRDAFHAAFPGFQRTGEGAAVAKILELHALHKSGREITISLGLSTLRLNNSWYGIGIIRDITEHRLAEDRLRTLSRGIEFTPASIVITDPRGNIEYVNRKFLDVTGYETSEVLGRNPRVLKSGETTPDEYTRLWTTITTGRTWYGEFHNRRKNGELYWENAIISPIYDTQGKITHFIAVKEDITEKKKTEDALRESEERYRAIIEQSSEGIYLVDIATRKIIQANPRCSSLLGYHDDEILGVSVYDIVDSSPESIDQRIDSIVRNREILSGERTYKRKNGSTLTVRISSTAVSYANRSTLCTIFDDITEQKRQVESLKESEERFRLISENVADIILFFETSGECLYASPSVSTLGRDPGDLPGHSLYALIHPDDRTRATEEIARLVATSSLRATAFRLSTSNGEWREMEASLSLLVSDAHCRVLAVLRDVSERRHHERSQEALLKELREKNVAIEEALARLTRMQEGLVRSEKMASLGQLTAGIAHEINNPLAFVSSNLNRFATYYGDVRSLLQQWKDAVVISPIQGVSPSTITLLQKNTDLIDLAFVDQDFSELMDQTRKGITRIKKIVEQLRGFAHLTKGEFALSNINQIIEETIALVWNELKYKVTVTRHYGEIPPVECSTGELQQVFVNLLVNAAHAILEKGTVTVTTQSEPPDVVITIADTGQGIPGEHLNRIFDPFFTTKPVGKGTGLGLWIVSTILQKHRGSIVVTSCVGKGSTFTIHLPVHHGEAPKHS
jgi:PAS domain S-box-containing protein